MQLPSLVFEPMLFVNVIMGCAPFIHTYMHIYIYIYTYIIYIVFNNPLASKAFVVNIPCVQHGLCLVDAHTFTFLHFNTHRVESYAQSHLAAEQNAS